MANVLTGYKYDTRTGQWVPQYAPAPSNASSDKTTGNANNSSSGGSSSSGSKSSSKTKKEPKRTFKEIELNLLTGDMNLNASKKTIRLASGDTIWAEGFGKYISGLFYVNGTTLSLDNSGGLTQTIEVVKMGFSDNLKK